MVWIAIQESADRADLDKGYAARVTAIDPTVAMPDFRQPFIGHLPGFREIGEAAGTGPPDEKLYFELIMQRWQALLDSPESSDERLLQTFLERHPSLLPGSDSVDGPSGHPPFPMSVVSKPKLAGLSDREPDFMWIATDSGSIYPILIEIETPQKPWFYGERAEIHSDLTHAQGQLAEWRAWFNRGQNRTAFLDDYQIPSQLRQRRLEPRFVLIYGRRANFEGSARRRQKRAELAREDERLMSFDRLSPTRHGQLYSCVRKTQDGYQVVAVPPCLTIFNNGGEYQPVGGWDQALDDCPDMAPARREYLKEQLHLLREPNDYATSGRGALVFRSARWL
jgi:hypothetical protein